MTETVALAAIVAIVALGVVALVFGMLFRAKLGPSGLAVEADTPKRRRKTK